MYIKNTFTKSSKTVKSKSVPCSERAKEGAHISTLVVRASSDFTISGVHKFNFFKRSGRIIPEYCKTCSAARRLLKIDGESVDYVELTLRHFEKGWDCIGYDNKSAQNELSEYLKNSYKQLLNNKI